MDIWHAPYQADFLGESIEALSWPYPQGEIDSETARFGESQAVYVAKEQAIISKGGSLINQIRAADALKWELAKRLGTDIFSSGGIELRLAT